MKIKKSKDNIQVWVVGFRDNGEEFSDAFSYSNTNDEPIIFNNESLSLNIGEKLNLRDYIEFIENSPTDEYALTSFYCAFPTQEGAISYFNEWIANQEKEVYEKYLNGKEKYKLFEAFIPFGTEYIKTKPFFVSLELNLRNRPGIKINPPKKLVTKLEYPDENLYGYLILEDDCTDYFSKRSTSGKPGSIGFNVRDESFLKEVNNCLLNGDPDHVEYFPGFRITPNLETAEKIISSEPEKNLSYVKCFIPQGKCYIKSPMGWLFTPIISIPTPMEIKIPEVTKEEKKPTKAEDTKSTTEYVGYNHHKMLNPPYLTATSSITCIDSYQKWEKKRMAEDNEEDGFRDLLIEIADCRGKIRLHNRGGDFEEFKQKVRTLRDELSAFLNHLENTPTPEKIITLAKKNFPDRYKD